MGRRALLRQACSSTSGCTARVASADKALELLALAKDADFATGTAAEDEALGDLVIGPQLRNSLYAFDLVQRRAKRPAGAPDKALARDVTKVGIVGAGLMAGQMALLFARRLEVPVVLTDLDQGRVDKGVAYVHGEIDKLQGKGRIDEGTAAKLRGLVSGSVDKAAFADADFVIEAVFEDLDVKKQVFAELEKIVSPEAVLATNTSSLSITEMAADLEHPERVVGFHFFNPVAVMPLLEIVRAEPDRRRRRWPPRSRSASSSKKSCVLVKDAPAFVVNRAADPVPRRDLRGDRRRHPGRGGQHARSTRWACRCARSRCSAWSGRRSRCTSAETMHAAFPDRFGVSANLARIVESGKPLTDRRRQRRPSRGRAAPGRRRPADRRAGARQRARRARRGGPH